MPSASASASSSTLAPRFLYRALLRELRSNPSNPRKVILTPAFTSQPIVSYVRNTFRASGSAQDNDVATSLKAMRDLEVFLRSNRVHKELLIRYNPLHDQTEAERVRATARRVGLDVPKEYQPHAEEMSQAVDSRSSRQRADDYKGRTGPLPPPNLDA